MLLERCIFGARTCDFPYGTAPVKFSLRCNHELGCFRKIKRERKIIVFMIGKVTFKQKDNCIKYILYKNLETPKILFLGLNLKSMITFNSIQLFSCIYNITFSKLMDNAFILLRQ